MNIHNFISQSSLELVIAIVVVIAALRLITAISFAAGRKAGRKQVFAAMEARWAAIEAQKEAQKRLEEARQSRDEAKAKKKKEGFGGSEVRRIVRKVDRRDWMRMIEVEECLSYEHQSQVESNLTSAETALEAALEAYNAAGEAKNAADAAYQRLK